MDSFPNSTEQLPNYGLSGVAITSKDDIVQGLKIDAQHRENHTNPDDRVGTRRISSLRRLADELETVYSYYRHPIQLHEEQRSVAYWLYNKRAEILKGNPSACVLGINRRIATIVGYSSWEIMLNNEARSGIGSLSYVEFYSPYNFVDRIDALEERTLLNALEKIRNEELTSAYEAVQSGFAHPDVVDLIETTSTIAAERKNLERGIEFVRDSAKSIQAEWLGCNQSLVDFSDETIERLKADQIVPGSSEGLKIAYNLYFSLSPLRQPRTYGGMPVNDEAFWSVIRKYAGDEYASILQTRESEYASTDENGNLLYPVNHIISWSMAKHQYESMKTRN